MKFLKQQDQRQQQQAAEQEKLKRLKEIAENQEAKLKKVESGSFPKEIFSGHMFRHHCIPTRDTFILN